MQAVPDDFPYGAVFKLEGSRCSSNEILPQFACSRMFLRSALSVSALFFGVARAGTTIWSGAFAIYECHQRDGRG